MKNAHTYVTAANRIVGGAALAVAALVAVPASAAPVDLSSWTQEGTGTWNLQSGNNAVVQTQNGNPTIFYSDYSAFGNRLSGTVQVGAGADNDFFGFVLGFTPGDLTDGASNFLLVDWKQGTQSGFGCSGDAGLAVSLVSAGLGDNAGAWCHEGFGVTELARGNTLGSTGWVDATEYTFDLEYTATNLKVFVDGLLQLDVDGAFGDGHFGFYNYSQAQVRYAGITNEVLPPVGAVPEPSTWLMMIVGFGMIGGAARHRRRRPVLPFA